MKIENKIALTTVILFALIIVGIIMIQSYLNSYNNQDCLRDIGNRMCKERGLDFENVVDLGFIFPDKGVICKNVTLEDYRLTGKKESVTYTKLIFYPNEIKACKK